MTSRGSQPPLAPHTLTRRAYPPPCPPPASVKLFYGDAIVFHQNNWNSPRTKTRSTTHDETPPAGRSDESRADSRTQERLAQVYARIDTGDSVSDLTAPGAVKRIKEKDRLGLGGGAVPMFLTYPAGTSTTKYHYSSTFSSKIWKGTLL